MEQDIIHTTCCTAITLCHFVLCKITKNLNLFKYIYNEIQIGIPNVFFNITVPISKTRQPYKVILYVRNEVRNHCISNY